MINSNILSLARLFSISIVICACTSSKPLHKNSEEVYTPVDRKLYDTILKVDSIVFDAFNNRDLATLEKYFDRELEFYHDLGGVTGYVQNMESFRKTFEKTRRVKRKVISSSVEVYPVKNFGAVQTGVHQFYAAEDGKTFKLSSAAKFTNLWKRTDTGWKITRVLSYGHRENLER
jgi:hypothetical protein